jgi:hypothetical protein
MSDDYDLTAEEEAAVVWAIANALSAVVDPLDASIRPRIHIAREYRGTVSLCSVPGEASLYVSPVFQYASPDLCPVCTRIHTSLN